MQNLSSLSQSSAGNITCAKNLTITGTATMNGAVDLTGATVTGMTLTASVVAPDTSDGAALGSTSLMWSDLFLASGAVVNFNNGDVTLTHSSGALTCSGNLTIGLIDTGSTSQLYVKGKGKIHLHDTTNGYCIEAKSNFNGTTTEHFGITSTVEYEPTGGTATAGGVQGLQGVGRLQASMTMTGGLLCGTYGQACNLGTINGAVQVAAMYGLVEDGGTFTSVGHVCSLWLDSHVTKMVTGEHELLWMTNNGTTKMDQAIYINVAADGSAFDYLIKFSADQSPVLTNALVPSAAPDAGTVGADRALKINVAGTAYYIPMYDTLHA